LHENQSFPLAHDSRRHSPALRIHLPAIRLAATTTTKSTRRWKTRPRILAPIPQRL
jgi:hypothetical protein